MINTKYSKFSDMLKDIAFTVPFLNYCEKIIINFSSNYMKNKKFLRLTSHRSLRVISPN